MRVGRGVPSISNVGPLRGKETNATSGRRADLARAMRAVHDGRGVEGSRTAGVTRATVSHHGKLRHQSPTWTDVRETLRLDRRGSPIQASDRRYPPILAEPRRGLQMLLQERPLDRLLEAARLKMRFTQHHLLEAARHARRRPAVPASPPRHRSRRSRCRTMPQRLYWRVPLPECWPVACRHAFLPLLQCQRLRAATWPASSVTSFRITMPLRCSG
jgi:hypothetical protein